MPDSFPATPRLTSLHRYPVKACAGEALTEARLDVDGVRHDRLLAVAVGDRIVTQREHPALSRVRPALDDVTALLTLDCDGRGAPAGVTAAVDLDGPRREVLLFGRPVGVVDQAEELSAWFTALLGAPAVLVAAPPTTRRTSPGVVEGLTLLSDVGTVSLHSEASLAGLNDRLAARGHPPLPGDRFRANLVVDGIDAHAEDHTGLLCVGEVRLAFAELDERCVVATVDQRVGRRAGPEPIRTLATYRRTGDGGVAFGIYAAVVAPGTVRVGDPVVLRPRS